ncbi:hypothetical protein F3Y22_tig00110009pilonHSYRG00225 [Hibiscus syriacus]|uniref:hAT-like transposase RNase-H fold domain-containing protein n=1 Tax=Hibiscus syriacus TaxID=106335 RepID=A0A6A3BT51_HIBSY|nr:hypothetical protein F3Y22_tig00110009pilonHSYRG00225 [Hibiscus syriacus]
MSSPLEISEPIASSHTNDNEVNVQVPVDSTQVEANNQENEHEEPVVGRKRKTSAVWNDFDEMEISHGVKKAVCRYCKSKFATDGTGSMQDDLSTIKDIIFNIRESVKYINHNYVRLKAFCDVVEQKCLKESKLVIHCPTRWNSTFNMLSTALKFKTAFSSYKERDPHYNYAPSLEEWNQVEKVCKLLEVFNPATHVFSGSEYPTANLYLAEVWKVKQILDKEIEDEDLFMREMVEVADENIKKVKSSFEELYDEYVGLCLQDSTSSVVNLDDNISSSSQLNTSFVTGFDEIMSMLCEKEVVSPIKSELQDYLDESIYVPNTNSFSALD